MSGNLAYELRGPLEDGPEIYDAVFGAGKDLGIQRLGLAHVPRQPRRGRLPPDELAVLQRGRPRSRLHGDGRRQRLQPADQRHGSVDPADARARLRTPVEVGWTRAVKFDHDFVGRAALEEEVAEPAADGRDAALEPRGRRSTSTRPCCSPARSTRRIDLPTSPPWTEGMNSHADHLLKDGKPIGWSSGTIYSYFFREVLSHACIDVDQAEIGNEVIVQWGDHGGRIKDVRATVERFPYLTDARNSDVDTADAGAG